MESRDQDTLATRGRWVEGGDGKMELVVGGQQNLLARWWW